LIVREAGVLNSAKRCPTKDGFPSKILDARQGFEPIEWKISWHLRPVSAEQSHQELPQGNAESAAELPVLQHPIFGKSASRLSDPYLKP